VWHRPFRLPLEEAASVVTLMFFAVQGAVPGIAPAQALATHVAAATPLMRVGGMAAQALVYGAIAGLLLRWHRRVLAALPRMPFALLLTLWVLATTVWSLDAALTLRRGAEFALAGGFGLYLVVRYSPQKQLRIFWWALVLLALGSVVAALAFPRMGLDASAGHLHDWKGVFTQKNACGRMMVLATAVVLAMRRRGWAVAASAALFVLVLVMSGSRGAWLLETVLLAGAALFAGLRRAERRTRAGILLAGGVGGVASLALLYAERVRLMASLGRNATLSGRTEIWQAVWPFVMQRPWMGWGYAAFWQGWTGPSFDVSAAVHFLVFHAHNGYLDLWLQTGVIGLGLFVLAYGRAWLRAGQRLARGQMRDLLWPVSLLLVVGLYGLDENTVLIPNGIFWTVLVMTMAQLEPGGLRQGLPLRMRGRAETRTAYAPRALPAR
jgi:O-antigen ligase